MIQFNLLPDVKLEYIKAKRLKNLMTGVSIIIAASTLTLAAILYIGVNISQKKHMNALNVQISDAAKKVSATTDIDRILTVQNQLSSLSGIHATKPAVTRLFGFLSQITPKDITISSATVDIVGSTMTINGQASDLHAVNTFVDTLKFTTYADTTAVNANDPTTAHPALVSAFTSVLLAGFSTDDKRSTYQVTMAYDPLLFNNQHKISLVVPSITTTRSQLTQPPALFEQVPDKKGGSQ